MDRVTSEAFNYIKAVATEMMNERERWGVNWRFITRWTGISIIWSDDSYKDLSQLTNRSKVFIGAYRSQFIAYDDAPPESVIFSIDMNDNQDEYPIAMKIVNNEGYLTLKRSAGDKKNSATWENNVAELIDLASIRVGVMSPTYPDPTISCERVASEISRFYNMKTPIPRGLIKLIDMSGTPCDIDIVATVSNGYLILADVNPVRFAHDEVMRDLCQTVNGSEYTPLYSITRI